MMAMQGYYINIAKITPLAVLLLIFDLTACATRNVDERHSTAAATMINGEAVFDCYNENHAWGHRLTGFYIAADGQVYRYRREGLAVPAQPVPKGGVTVISAAELSAKYAGKSPWTRIAPAELRIKAAMIANAAAGTITRVRTRTVDAGQSLCVAYRYDASRDSYTAVPLGSFGPTEIQTNNSAPAATALLHWLDSIGE